LVSGSPLYEQGTQIGSFAMLTNITPLKKAQKEIEQANLELEDRVEERTAQLQEAMEELRATSEMIEEKNVELEKLSIVASGTDNAVIIMDADGTLEWVNDAFIKFYGYTLNEYTSKFGENVLNASTNADISNALEMVQTALSSVSYESSMICKNGNKLYVQTTLSPILDDWGGLKKIIAIDADITNMKEAEEEILQQNEEIIAQSEALIESEQKLHDIIQFLPDAVVVINTEGEITEWNNAMEILTGKSAEEMVGLGNYEYSIPFYGVRRPILIDLVFLTDEQFSKNYSHIHRVGNVLIGESYVPDLKGMKKYLVGTASALYDHNDTIVGAIEIVRDITEKKEAEAEILLQRDEIIAQRDKIQEQSNIANEHRKHLTDSIQYASRIQQAMLPTDDLSEKLGDKHFVLYLPKDIVSGDFYWLSNKDNKTIIAAADCTGHGVPGGFLTMLGITFLNEIVSKLPDADVLPSDILYQLRSNLIKSLHQTGKTGETKDGMDIALCIIDNQNKTLSFAGANNPLYFVRTKNNANNQPFVANKGIKIDATDTHELLQVNGDKMPIGIHLGETVPFSSFEIKFSEGDRFYICSDGYVDQFGGERGGKFLSKNFRKLLLKLQNLPMEKQKNELLIQLDLWQGKNHAQVDDILVVGVEL